MDNKSIIAKNLKYYMKLNNKSRKDVCNDLGFSYYTYSDWVNGKKYPRMDKVEMLAKYFNIKKSDLIEEKITEQFEAGELIRKIRLSNNITLLEMAEEFNIRIDDLMDYEKGVKKVPMDLLKKIADYYGININHNVYLDYYKHDNESDLSAGMRVIEINKRWNDEVGETHFSDDEMTELINFAKYIISKRKDHNKG